MNRSGSFLMLLLAGLAVFAVVYLLFGDSMGEGLGGSAYGGGGAGDGADLLGASSASLETKGKRPPTAAEIAAKKAAEEAARTVVVKKEDGVFGTVTDARGRPIKNAVIKMLADPPETRHKQGVPDGEPLATAVSDEEGAFIVGPSPPDQHAKLRAEAAGYAASVQRVRRKGVRVDFILDRGGSLELRVLDMKGKVVEGVTVLHQAGTVITSGLTDGSGDVRFASLPTGTGSLIATKPGFGAVRDHNVAVAPGETEKRTLVLPHGLEVQGQVVDGETERPIAGALVTARYPNLPTLEAEAGGGVTTDEEGKFKITGFVSGQEQMILRVAKKEFAEARMWRNAQTKGDVTVKLFKAGEALEGRVVDAEGQPTGGVKLTYASMQNEDKADVPEATSDNDGNFVLPLPAWGAPGSGFTVIALSDSSGVGTSQASVPRKGQPRAKQLEIKLGGVGSVAGTVKDTGGQPVQGAIVSLAPDWNAARKNSRGGQVPWQVLNLINAGQHHNLSAVTGIDGTYEIVGVPALSYQVTAAHGLDQFTLPDAVTVTSGDKANADISLGEGGTIEGWILDSDEKPIAGAYVYASPVNSRGWNWWRRQPTARSQSDGKFILRGVTDEPYNLTAYASGYGNAQQKNARMGDTEIQLRLKAKGWIEGVVNTEGRPYAGMFTVIVRPVQVNNNNMNRWGGWYPGQQQRTFNTSDGKFKVKGLNAGDYTVQASTNDGLLAIQQDVVSVMDGRASREASLELRTGAVLSGTVRDDETGRGVSGVWVYANGKSENGRVAPGGYSQTDSKGRYEIKGLGSGAYTLTAYVNGTSVTEKTDLQFGDKRTLDVVKRPPGQVLITVVDQDGNPVVGARPNLQSTTGNWVGINISALRKDGIIGDTYDWQALYNTGEDGTLTRYHVPPGILTVWAWKSGYSMTGQRPQIEVATGQTTHITIKMKKAGARPPSPSPPGRR